MRRKRRATAVRTKPFRTFQVWPIDLPPIRWQAEVRQTDSGGGRS
jgi:hypothetical protein